MRRTLFRLTTVGYAILAIGLVTAVSAQDGQAARGQGGGRGRSGAPPPPPPETLTCTSKATAWDNKVPAALARDGFVSIFNGVDLTGWQALIDIGTLRYGAGLNPADLQKLTPAERAARQQESNDVYLKHWSV